MQPLDYTGQKPLTTCSQQGVELHLDELNKLALQGKAIFIHWKYRHTSHHS